MTGLSRTSYTPSIYAGPGALTATAYPLAIDAATAALAFVAAPWQPTVTNTDMAVHVAAGVIPTASGVTAIAAQTVTLGAAHATLPRIDRVVLDRVTGTASVVAGTAASSPGIPVVPTGKLPCCRILVPAAVTALVNTNGTDERLLWLLGLGSASFKSLGGCVVDDGSGNLTVDAHLLTVAGSVDLSNDAVLIYSAAAGAPRKVAPSLLGGVTQAQFASLQQDVIQNYMLDAINGAWAAGQYSNGGYDAFNSDTLSGVSGTANQTYDGAAKLYKNPSTTGAVYGGSAAFNTTGNAGITYVDESYTLPNNVTIASIGCYQTSAISVALKICKKNSSGNYDIVYSQTITTSTSGWQDFTLTTPYAIPSSGSYYVGIYSASNFAYSTSHTACATASGNVTGTGQALAEHTTDIFGPLTRATSADIPAPNMTLVSAALSPAPASSPSKAQLMVLWKAIDAATPNTDFTVEVTANGGTNWVLGTLADTGITMAGGFRLLLTTVTLSSGGTTVQCRVKTLNNKSQQVKAIGLLYQ